MTNLNLNGCNLTGVLPRFHPNLVSLSLLGNKLQGTLPPDYFPTGCDLMQLRLDGNNITGTLPSSLNRASRLTALDIGCPWSTAPLNLGVFAPFVNLTRLTLSGADFVFSAGQSFFTQLGDTLTLFTANNVNFNGAALATDWGKLTKLTALSLVNANISGTVPQLARTLSQLVLDRNELLEGELSYAEMPNLTRLSVSFTKLKWMTSSLGLLTKLVSLVASATNATGPLLSDIGKLSQLTQLSIPNNAITGLPESLSSLTNLERLDLANNAIVALDLAPFASLLTNLTQCRLAVNGPNERNCFSSCPMACCNGTERACATSTTATQALASSASTTTAAATLETSSTTPTTPTSTTATSMTKAESSSTNSTTATALLVTGAPPPQSVDNQAVGIGIGVGVAALLVVVAIGVAAFICRKPRTLPVVADVHSRQSIYGSMAGIETFKDAR